MGNDMQDMRIMGLYGRLQRGGGGMRQGNERHLAGRYQRGQFGLNGRDLGRYIERRFNGKISREGTRNHNAE